MNRYISAVVLIFSLCLSTWGIAQGVATAVDKKSNQEIEIMRGILETTLNLVLREIRQREPETRHSRGRDLLWNQKINSFYLPGQGVLFYIPMSGSRAFFPFFDDEVLRDAELMAQEAQEQAREAMFAQQEYARALAETMEGKVPAPPAPPVPPAPPTPPSGVSERQTGRPERVEEVRKRLQETQEQIKKRREEMLARQQKAREYLDEVKGYLVETLANHGDSLTQLKPSEYLNLIIASDSLGGDRMYGDSEAQAGYAVISVQKSLIMDYKAGRLSLESFKQKVLP